MTSFFSSLSGKRENAVGARLDCRIQVRSEYKCTCTHTQYNATETEEKASQFQTQSSMQTEWVGLYVRKGNGANLMFMK